MGKLKFKIPINKTKIVPILIGLFISVIALVMVFRFGPTLFTRASDSAPRDVTINNITNNSAKISWTTGASNQGVVEYGTSPTSLNFFAPETDKTKNHNVDLTLLSPNTTYYFQIRIGNKKYDNGGVPWTFTTRSNQDTQEQKVGVTTTPAAGVTKQPQGTPVKSNTSPTPTPTPISTVIIPPKKSPAPQSSSCTETDCSKIKEKLGQGCTTQDYIKCLKNQATTPTSTPSGTL